MESKRKVYFGENFEVMDVFGAPETGPGSKVRFSPGSDNAKALAFKKTIAEGNVSSADILLDKDAAADITSQVFLKAIKWFSIRLNANSSACLWRYYRISPI